MAEHILFYIENCAETIKLAERRLYYEINKTDLRRGSKEM